MEKNVKDEMSSSSEDEEASPDIGHDICLETYSGSFIVYQNMPSAHLCAFIALHV